MRNIWIGLIIIAVVVIAGVMFASRKNSNTQPANPTNQITPNFPSPESSSSSPSAQEQNMIILTSSGFTPVAVTIKAGDAVTWSNKSGSDATINSDPHPVHTDYPLLNLGSFPDGRTLSLSFPKAGTYKYHNHLNPSEMGTIVVK